MNVFQDATLSFIESKLDLLDMVVALDESKPDSERFAVMNRRKRVGVTILIGNQLRARFVNDAGDLLELSYGSVDTLLGDIEMWIEGAFFEDLCGDNVLDQYEL